MTSAPRPRSTKADPQALNFFPNDSSLRNIEFPASCPPDISRRTRIVAVCGITDIDNRASPNEDGWFFSDFWMFRYLFQGVSVANQLWLTCCNAEDLVRKYGRYAHGNPSRDRKVVLEEGMPGDIASAGTMRYTEPKTLLERFLKTVQSECKIALKADQDVLILIFGHGMADNYGITIGSSSNIKFEPAVAPQLTIPRLKIAIGSQVKCTLLLTSCYSGGWAMHPDLNLTIIAAAGSKRESSSWQTSLNRAHSGSIVASAIRDAIFTHEVEGRESEGGTGAGFGELENSETYAEMGCLIHDHLKESDRLFAEHEISFAVQDDKWATCWRARTGIPLSFYKDRWDRLSVVPAQPQIGGNRHPAASLDHERDPFSFLKISTSRTGSHSLSTEQMFLMVYNKALQYARSNPGEDNLASNVGLHNKLWALLQGKEDYVGKTEEMINFWDAISYRLDCMELATRYREYLDLPGADCGFVSIAEWNRKLSPPSRSPSAEEDRKREEFYEITSMIRKGKIFFDPVGSQGYFYYKGHEYLAIAFVESGLTRVQIEEKISILKNYQKDLIASKVKEVRQGRWFTDTANSILKPIKKTLRSISPSKRRSVVSIGSIDFGRD